MPMLGLLLAGLALATYALRREPLAPWPALAMVLAILGVVAAYVWRFGMKVDHRDRVVRRLRGALDRTPT